MEVGRRPNLGPPRNLAHAAHRGDAGAVAKFLKEGAAPDAADPEERTYDETPLSLAAACGHEEVVRLLLGAGASVRSAKGSDALSAAVDYGRTEVAKLLIEKGAKWEGDGGQLLNSAAGVGNRQMVDVLLAAGAEVNARDRHGSTPLHEAVYENRRRNGPEIADLLLKKGAKVNAGDDQGWTPLLWAVRTGSSPRVVEVLLRHGADAAQRTSGARRRCTGP